MAGAPRAAAAQRGLRQTQAASQQIQMNLPHIYIKVNASMLSLICLLAFSSQCKVLRKVVMQAVLYSNIVFCKLNVVHVYVCLFPTLRWIAQNYPKKRFAETQ